MAERPSSSAKAAALASASASASASIPASESTSTSPSKSHRAKAHARSRVRTASQSNLWLHPRVHRVFIAVFVLALLAFVAQQSLLSETWKRLTLHGLARRWSSRGFDSDWDAANAVDVSDEEDQDRGPDEAAYPAEIYRQGWKPKVSLDHIRRLSVLHGACLDNKDSIIPWDLHLQTKTEKQADGRHIRRPDPKPSLSTDKRNNANRTTDGEFSSEIIHEGDPNAIDKLRQCPDVDIFVPSSHRGHGYCEDAVVFAEFLHSRVLPYWAIHSLHYDPRVQRNVSYHELCPTTPMIFFNHYWYDLPLDSMWPAGKPIYLMPNIEMYELESKYLRRVDVVLCRTRTCQERMEKWYHDHGNRRNTQVLYTRFTSTDLALYARDALRQQRQKPPHLVSNASAPAFTSITPKDFSSLYFLHTSGNSCQKGTQHVLDCWLSRPDFPMLELYMTKRVLDDFYGEKYADRVKESQNIHLHVGSLDALGFGQLFAEAAAFLCTSIMEGYGHYINQARAAGGLVLTPNMAPMNELVTPSSGVLVDAKAMADEHQFLGGTDQRPSALRGVDGINAWFKGSQVCEAVETILDELEPKERQRRARRARRQYLYDTAVFAEEMESLRKFAREPHPRRRSDDDFWQ